MSKDGKSAQTKEPTAESKLAEFKNNEKDKNLTEEDKRMKMSVIGLMNRFDVLVEGVDK